MFSRRLLYRKYLIAIFTVLSLGLLGCAASLKDKTLSAEEQYKKGIEKFAEKKYKNSAEIFKKILDEFPGSKIRPLSLMALARSEYQKGDYEEAKFHFEQFVEQFPANPQVVKAY